MIALVNLFLIYDSPIVLPNLGDDVSSLPDDCIVNQQQQTAFYRGFKDGKNKMPSCQDFYDGSMRDFYILGYTNGQLWHNYLDTIHNEQEISSYENN